MRRLVRERLVKPHHFEVGDRVVWPVPTEEGREIRSEGMVAGHTASAVLVKFKSLGLYTVRPSELDRPAMSLTLEGVLVNPKKYPEARVLCVGDTMFLHEGRLKRVR